jgi:predicted TIM-barrel fold metal-dependent hydrolase
MTIDMHAHWFPETLADAFRKRTSKPWIYTKEDGKEYLEGSFPAAPLRLESLDARLSEMDRTGVELGILSLSPVTGIEGLAAEESVPLCRIVNDALSAACSKYPGRFSGLASLPTADTGVMVAEFERTMALPGMVGAMLAGDGFLSLKRAERFRPVLEAADRYGAIMLVHYGRIANDAEPVKIDSSDNGHPRVGTLDMQSRLSQNMITFCMTDFLKSFPNVTVLSHNLGGNIPFEIERMDHRTMIDMPPGTELPSKKFRAAPVLVDCNSLGARAIELAAEVYGADKIVFGSDGTGFGMEWTQKAIKEARLTEHERDLIRHNNAAAAIAKVKRPMAAAAE